MKKRNAIFFSFIFLAGVAAVTFEFGNFGGGRSGGPFLYSPCTENISLEGKKTLEFRWKPLTSFPRGYDFKLYKGFEETDQNLLLHEEIQGPARSFSVPVKYFDEGKVFSWVLTEIFLNGQKSERSFCSFEIQQ